MKVLIVIIIFGLYSSMPIFSQTPEVIASNEITLPAKVDDVILAKKGAVLLLKMNKTGNIALFDINTEKITGNVPFSSNDTLVAGTSDSIFLYQRDKKEFKRWTIEPLANAQTIASPIMEEIDSITAGHAGFGPILIMNKKGPKFLDATNLSLIKTEIAKKDEYLRWGEDRFLVTASADGYTFAIDGFQPRLLRFDNKKLLLKNGQKKLWGLAPNSDGSLLFANGKVYTADFNQLERKWEDYAYPSLCPAYYVGIRSGGENGNASVSLYQTNEDTPLLTLFGLPGLGEGIDIPEKLRVNCRIIAHPLFKKLIVINENATSLYIIPLDVVKALNEKGSNYLHVASFPITKFELGKKYEYAIKVLSKSGNIKFTLDSGPEDMTINQEGLLTWGAPKNFTGEKTSVIVTIEDSSKQRIYHAFAIYASDLKIDNQK